MRLTLLRGHDRLENVPLASADRPPIGPSPTCHIVESWDAFPAGTSSDRDIHVYSSGTTIDLAVNGKKVGTQTVGGWHDADPEKGETPGGVTFSSVGCGVIIVVANGTIPVDIDVQLILD